jgi:hypothetical protein
MSMPNLALHPDRCICHDCVLATLDGTLALFGRGADAVAIAALERLRADYHADRFGAEVERKPDAQRRAQLRRALDDGKVTPAEVAAGFKITETELPDLLSGRLRFDKITWRRAARLLTA